ncbi:hypothetical protein Sjap_006645 [Stephania japonica]|uniref:Peptidase A1 domain-containing protein n=1 Tax=Stephania japonica TaxID=461633 RepID=A0AAP0K698_9MAGN
MLVLCPSNPTLHGIVQVGPVCQDALSMQSTNGSYLTLPHYIFPCATNYMIPGLPDGVTGVVGLGRSRISLPSQLSSALGLDKRFTICLPSSSKAKGFIVFGSNGIDISSLPLTYTPLLSNPVSTVIAPRGEPSYEYFIGVKSVTINSKVVPFNTSMLVIDRKSGYGGTKISTGYPYSTLKTEIYKAFIETFIREAEAMKLKKVAAVEPFAACFSVLVARTKFRPMVPTIDLVLESGGVWRMFGGNSMVEVGKGVMCLGFVEEEIREFKEEEERTSIVIGGHQLEDIVLRFDLALSTMAFSAAQSTCSKYFNFTSKA